MGDIIANVGGKVIPMGGVPPAPPHPSARFQIAPFVRDELNTLGKFLAHAGAKGLAQNVYNTAAAVSPATPQPAPDAGDRALTGAERRPSQIDGQTPVSTMGKTVPPVTRFFMKHRKLRTLAVLGGVAAGAYAFAKGDKTLGGGLIGAAAFVHFNQRAGWL